jgi:predicted NBD/HSP70 family sugar kinase
MSKKSEKPAPAAVTEPTAPVTETSTLEELAADVAAGGATVEHEGEILEAVELDITPDASTDVVETTTADREPGLHARPVPVVEAIALGAPGTMAVQGEDGAWHAVPVGEA